MTGRESLRMQGALHGLRGAPARERPTSLLDWVGSPRRATAASAATRAACAGRLELALALVHRSVVLFPDEPTTGLDPTSRAALLREMRRINDEGTSVFLTTQYLEEAEQLADRAGIIAGGRPLRSFDRPRVTLAGATSSQRKETRPPLSPAPDAPRRS